MAKDKTGRKVKEHRLLEKVGSEPEGGGFARALGSTDFHTRERGLQALTVWLSRKRDIQPQDLLRLWKALFYCFWHSDKSPVQVALAERLSEIMTAVPEAVGDLYFRSFVRTMRREWFGIDRLRLDKFMMLVRKFYTQHLRHLQAREWDAAAMASYADFWRDEVLLPRDTAVAAGVAYHFTEMLLPQLAAVAAEGLAPPPAAAVDALLAPYAAALAGTADPVLLRRLQSGLFGPVAEEVREPGEGRPLKHLDVGALAARLFELGAQKETRGGNREALYAISKSLAQADSLGKKGKKPRQQQQQHVEQQAVEVAAPAPQEQQQLQQHQQKDAKVAEPRKPKKRKAAEAALGGGTPAAANGHPAPAPAPAAVAAAAPQPTPSQPPAKKKSKKSKGGTPGANGAGPSSAGAPHAARPAPAAREYTPDESPRKKNVRFSLKRNLVMTIGQPPAPADVRTPPTSRPQGSALKKVSGVSFGSAPGRMQQRLAANLSRAAGGQHRLARSASKPGGGGGRGAGAGLPSPKHTPRPRAAEFF